MNFSKASFSFENMEKSVTENISKTKKKFFTDPTRKICIEFTKSKLISIKHLLDFLFLA